MSQHKKSSTVDVDSSSIKCVSYCNVCVFWVIQVCYVNKKVCTCFNQEYSSQHLIFVFFRNTYFSLSDQTLVGLSPPQWAGWDYFDYTRASDDHHHQVLRMRYHHPTQIGLSVHCLGLLTMKKISVLSRMSWKRHAAKPVQDGTLTLTLVFLCLVPMIGRRSSQLHLRRVSSIHPNIPW